MYWFFMTFAKSAIERGTGARGLRAEIERAMQDVMFDAPDKCKPGDEIELSVDGVRIRHGKIGSLGKKPDAA